MAYLPAMNKLTTFLSALTLAALPAAADHHKEKPAAPTPEQALERLMEGNARFVSGEMKHPNLGQEMRETLAQGQSPFAIIVGCADSRVSPELLFDAGPGDLFVIRVAGNVVGDHAKASIEYAVAVLGSPLVVVLGHESCGAVDAAIKAEKGEASFDGHIHDLVEDIRPSVQAAMASHEGSEGLLDATVAENARRVKGELERSQPYIGKFAKEGKIGIVAARYDLDTGTVTRVDTHHGHDHGHGHNH